MIYKGRHITLMMKDACIMYNHSLMSQTPAHSYIQKKIPLTIQGKNVVPSCYEKSRTHGSTAVVMWFERCSSLKPSHHHAHFKEARKRFPFNAAIATSPQLEARVWNFDHRSLWCQGFPMEARCVQLVSINKWK